MKVTGFKLKQAVKMIGIDISALTQELNSSYSKSEGEEKRTIKEIVSELQTAESNLAKVQSVQALYNQTIIVDGPLQQAPSMYGKPVPLALVIKMEGVNARIAKVWKDTAKQTDRYALREEPGVVSQVYPKECFQEVKVLATASAKLQSLIGTANSRELEIGDVLDGIAL